MIYDKLYDWQKKIVDHVKTKSLYGLYLDMGLGKTPISLAIAEQNFCNKILVVTINAKASEPASVPGSWGEWTSRLGPALYNFYRKSGGTFTRNSRDVMVVNYEYLFKRDPDAKSVGIRPEVDAFLESCAGQRCCLILDESHKIKDSSSSQSKAINAVRTKMHAYSNFFCSYLLSGTPFTTGFIDLFAQLKYLGCPMTKQQFKDNFCKLGHIKGLLEWQQPIVGYKNIDSLYKILHKYSITMKSGDVLSLPPQIVQNHICPTSDTFTYLTQETLTGEEFEAHKQYREKNSLPKLPDDWAATLKGRKIISPWYRNIDYPNFDYLCDTPATLWMRARQLSIGFQGNAEKATWYDTSRLAKLYDFLERNPDNYVLFYNYTPEFFEIFKMCESLDYNIDVYNGEIKSLNFYEKFAKQPEEEKILNRKNVIISNFASGSTGMNWQLYSKCIIFSLPLYKDWEQGLKRVHRNGSKEPVTYHVFYGDNWLDADMKSALDTGVQYSKDLFNKKLNEVQ